MYCISQLLKAQSDVLFCLTNSLKPKDIQFTIIGEKKQKTENNVGTFS